MTNYHEYLKTDLWQVQRTHALERAENKCSVCGAADKTLHVHHNNYERLGKEKLSDLVVLCEDCHAKYHDKYKAEERQLSPLGKWFADKGYLTPKEWKAIAAIKAYRDDGSPDEFYFASAELQDAMTEMKKFEANSTEWFFALGNLATACTRRALAFRNEGQARTVMQQAIMELNEMERERIKSFIKECCDADDPDEFISGDKF